MSDFAIRIVDSHEVTLFSKPLDSLEDMNKLKEDLVDKSDKMKRFNFLFPTTIAATQIQNYVLRVFSTIGAFFLDFITLPICYFGYKKIIRNNLPVHKFLKGIFEEKRVSTNFLNQDSYRVYFYSITKEERTGKNVIEEKGHPINILNINNMPTRGIHRDIDIEVESERGNFFPKLFTEEYCIK